MSENQDQLKKDVIELLTLLNKRKSFLDSIELILSNTLLHNNKHAHKIEEQFYLLMSNRNLSQVLISYLASEDILEEIDGSLQKSLYKLNELKAVYGLVLRDHVNEQTSNPFVLSSANISIEDNSNYHTIKFFRIDGESLNALFTTASMLGMLGLLSDVTKQSINKGIFNLNETTINYYLESSKNLIDTLEGLKGKVGKNR